MFKFQKLLQNSKTLKHINSLRLFTYKRNLMPDIFASSAQFSSRTTSQQLQSRRHRSEYKEMSSKHSRRNIHTANTSNSELDHNQLLIKMKEGLIIIDVRNPDEIEKNGRVQGALEIPLPVLKNEFDLSPDEWKQKYNRVKPESEAQIMLICAAGVRSKKGTKVLEELGYKNVFSYKGGYQNFKEQK